MADFEEAGDDDVFRKIRKDFDAKGVAQSDAGDPRRHARADGQGDRRDQGRQLIPPSTFSLARRLRAGETVYCGWCALGAPIVAETLAREGFSAVAIDMQHGLWDVAAAADAIAAIHHAGSAPLLRVPAGDFAFASRALDFGAQGVIAPMINSAADARTFVAAAKYPPLGERSWGPMRATMLTGIDQRDYLRRAMS